MADVVVDGGRKKKKEEKKEKRSEARKRRCKKKKRRKVGGREGRKEIEGVDRIARDTDKGKKLGRKELARFDSR